MFEVQNLRVRPVVWSLASYGRIGQQHLTEQAPLTDRRCEELTVLVDEDVTGRY